MVPHQPTSQRIHAFIDTQRVKVYLNPTLVFLAGGQFKTGFTDSLIVKTSNTICCLVLPVLSPPQWRQTEQYHVTNQKRIL